MAYFINLLLMYKFKNKNRCFISKKVINIHTLLSKNSTYVMKYSIKYLNSLIGTIDSLFLLFNW